MSQIEKKCSVCGSSNNVEIYFNGRHGEYLCSIHNNKYNSGRTLVKYRECEICGISNLEKSVSTKNNKFKRIICDKHRTHLRRYGYTKIRTLFTSNEIIIRRNFAEIVIYDKNNKPFTTTKIDKEDIEKVKNIRWGLAGGGNKYVCNRISKSRETLQLHNFLMNFQFIENKKMMIDHINRNTLDNRKKNLRIVDSSTNQYNQKISTKNKSGVKGICWNKNVCKWRAYINYNKKQIRLGSFKNKHDAIIIRSKAEVKFLGEIIRKDIILATLKKFKIDPNLIFTSEYNV